VITTILNGTLLDTQRMELVGERHISKNAGVFESGYESVAVTLDAVIVRGRLEVDRIG